MSTNGVSGQSSDPYVPTIEMAKLKNASPTDSKAINVKKNLFTKNYLEAVKSTFFEMHGKISEKQFAELKFFKERIKNIPDGSNYEKKARQYGQEFFQAVHRDASHPLTDNERSFAQSIETGAYKYGKLLNEYNDMALELAPSLTSNAAQAKVLSGTLSSMYETLKSKIKDKLSIKETLKTLKNDFAAQLQSKELNLSPEQQKTILEKVEKRMTYWPQKVAKEQKDIQVVIQRINDTYPGITIPNDAEKSLKGIIAFERELKKETNLKLGKLGLI